MRVADVGARNLTNRPATNPARSLPLPGEGAVVRKHLIAE